MDYLPTPKLLLMAICAACIAVLLIGCAAAAPAPPPVSATATAAPAPAPSATPAPRGGDLTIRLADDVPDLRPWQPRSRGEEQISGLLYRGLTRLDPDLRPQPDLATGWDAAPDGRLITFTLRTDVTWHDGRPFSADDVVFTLQALRTISPTTALLSDLRRVAAVSAPTSSTVVLSLTERYAPLFAELTLPILPRHLLAGRDLATINFWDVAIGTGPFQVSRRLPGTSVQLAPNRAFYGGAPLLDSLTFVVAPDDAASAAALRSGSMGLAEFSAAPETPPGGTQTGRYAENGYYFLAFNMRDGRLFADTRLREALSLAIDRAAIVSEAAGARGIAVGSSAAPGSWAARQGAALRPDAVRAGQLLDESGWRAVGDAIRARDGITLTARLAVRADDLRRVRAADAIARQVRAIGIELTVVPLDFETGIRPLYQPPYDFDLLLGSWSNGVGDPAFADYAYYDPDDFALFHSSQMNQGVGDVRPVLNIVGMNDGVYDTAAVAARQLYRFDDRLAAQTQAQQRVAAVRPYLFLWADAIEVELSGRVAAAAGPIRLDTPMYLWNIQTWYVRPAAAGGGSTSAGSSARPRSPS